VVDTMSRNVSGGQDVQVATSATGVSTVHARLTSLVVVLAISAAAGWFTCLLLLKDLWYGFGVDAFNAVFMAFSLVLHLYLSLCLAMGFAAGHLFFACFFGFPTLNRQVLNQAGMVVCISFYQMLGSRILPVPTLSLQRERGVWQMWSEMGWSEMGGLYCVSVSMAAAIYTEFPAFWARAAAAVGGAAVEMVRAENGRRRITASKAAAAAAFLGLLF